MAYGKISLFEGNNNLVLTLQGSQADWRLYLLIRSNHRFHLIKLVSLILVDDGDDDDDDDDDDDYYYYYCLYDQIYSLPYSFFYGELFSPRCGVHLSIPLLGIKPAKG